MVMKPIIAYKRLRLSYIHSMSATCFGRTCDHPQGGALQRIYLKTFEPVWLYIYIYIYIYIKI